MNRTTLTYTEAEIASAAQMLLETVSHTGRRVVALYADMGVGKTTLVSALCEAMHTLQPASSPTFALINEYTPANDTEGNVANCLPIYHFDFYRIERAEEALDLGIYDYIDSGALCLIEWPEHIEELLPADTLWVRLERNTDDTRTITIYTE